MFPGKFSEASRAQTHWSLHTALCAQWRGERGWGLPEGLVTTSFSCHHSSLLSSYYPNVRKTFLCYLDGETGK